MPPVVRARTLCGCHMMSNHLSGELRFVPCAAGRQGAPRGTPGEPTPALFVVGPGGVPTPSRPPEPPGSSLLVAKALPLRTEQARGGEGPPRPRVSAPRPANRDEPGVDMERRAEALLHPAFRLAMWPRCVAPCAECSPFSAAEKTKALREALHPHTMADRALPPPCACRRRPRPIH